MMTATEGLWALISRRSSKPDPSGSIRSQRTRSGSAFCNAARPSTSVAAVWARQPSSSKTMLRKSRSDASSSTINRSISGIDYLAFEQRQQIDEPLLVEIFVRHLSEQPFNAGPIAPCNDRRGMQPHCAQTSNQRDGCGIAREVGREEGQTDGRPAESRPHVKQAPSRAILRANCLDDPCSPRFG